jgi:hypothetical protein
VHPYQPSRRVDIPESPEHTVGRWLNVGIFAACFGIFVSLSDFILTSRQKKKLEQIIDGITLRLDHTETFDWLR